MWNFIKPCRPLLRSSLRYGSPSRPLVAMPLRVGARYSSTSESKSPSVDPRQRYTAEMRPKPDNMRQLLQLEGDMVYREFLDTLTYMHKWGFVIYRGTYDDEEQWTITMRWLYERALDTIEHMWAPQEECDKMWDRLDLTVIDDRKRLEGASLQTVRSEHRRWVLKSSESGRGGPLPLDWMQHVVANPIISYREWEYYSRGPRGFPRYAFCVYIDKDSLDSIMTFKDQKKIEKDAYIRVLRTFYLDHPPPANYEVEQEDIDALENSEEPVEGCRRWDVGWMKYRAQDIINLYINLHEVYSWDYEYSRPPLLAPHEGTC